jgi:hypothetical protein
MYWIVSRISMNYKKATCALNGMLKHPPEKARMPVTA